MTEFLINKSQRDQTIERVIHLLGSPSISQQLQILNFIDDHCELAILKRDSARRLDEALNHKIRDPKVCDMVRIRAMQSLTQFYCLDKRNNESFPLYVQLLLTWVSYTNNERSQFARHKAAQCLEELQKHREIDLSKYLLGQQSNNEEAKYKSLSDLLKNSNDWTTQQYSSLVRVVSKQTISSEQCDPAQFKQVANSMWEIKEQCGELELVGILKYMYTLKAVGTDIQEMMLYHQYKQILKLESPLAIQFLIFTVISNTQKFDGRVVQRILQKLVSIVNNTQSNRGISLLALRWLNYLISHQGISKKDYNLSEQLLSIEMFPLPLRNQIIQTLLTFQGQLMSIPKIISQTERAFQKSTFYIANSQEIISMFRNFFFILHQSKSQKSLKIILSLITRILRFNSNYQWSVLALGEKLGDSEETGVCTQSAYYDHILQSVVDFKPQSRLPLYFPMLIFFSKKLNVKDDLILEILKKINEIQKQRFIQTQNEDWTNSKNILKVCRNLILNNKQDQFQARMIEFLSQLCEQNREISIREEAQYLRNLIQSISTEFKQNMLLKYTSSIQIKPPLIKQIDYKDDLIPGIEFLLDKDLRKQHKLLDDASSIFCQEYVPEQKSIVKAQFTQGKVSQIENEKPEVIVQRGIIIPFILRMNPLLCPFDHIINIEIYFAQSDTISLTYPKYIPILKRMDQLDSEDQLSKFPYQFHLNVLVETKLFIPCKIDASISFNTDDGAFHYGQLGTYQIEYEDFFHQKLPEVDLDMFRLTWEKTKSVISIRVLYVPDHLILAEMDKRLQPFIVSKAEEANQIQAFVYIELPPTNSLLFQFRIKKGKTVVDFRSDTKDVLNWIDAFFDKWDSENVD